jgi:hypothetical protein
MNAVEVVQKNFNNWNRHDAEAIVAAFAEGGPTITPTKISHLPEKQLAISPKWFGQSFLTSRST